VTVVATGAWAVAGATARGSAHTQTGMENQDAFAHDEVSGWHILAVADGAGSAPRSGEGSRLACDAAVASLKNGVAGLAEGATESEDERERLVREAVGKARSALVQRAEDEGEPVGAFATTLIVALVTPEGEAVVGHVGDGLAVGLVQGGALELLSQPDKGEYANQTSFLTEAEPELRIRSGLVGLEAVAASTDGLERLVIDSIGSADASPHEPFWTPVFEAVGSCPDAATRIERLLQSDAVGKRTTDDRTLLVACKSSEVDDG
jgi:hypothetical protein